MKQQGHRQDGAGGYNFSLLSSSQHGSGRATASQFARGSGNVAAIHMRGARSAKLFVAMRFEEQCGDSKVGQFRAVGPARPSFSLACMYATHHLVRVPFSLQVSLGLGGATRDDRVWRRVGQAVRECGPEV